jgi:hypothetical protein
MEVEHMEVERTEVEHMEVERTKVVGTDLQSRSLCLEVEHMEVVGMSTDQVMIWRWRCPRSRRCSRGE